MTVNVYRWDDPGAPVLPNSAPRSFDNLRTLLMACLVNGYGDKPAAGWTVGHDVTGGFSLSNGEGIISFLPLTDPAVRIYLMEAITDPSTALPGGVNRRSGRWYDGSTSNEAQYVYMPYFYSSHNYKRWVIVADDKTAHIHLCAYREEVDARQNDAVSFSFGRYFPDIGEHGFYVCGGAVNAVSSTVAIIAAPNTFNGTSLRNPKTGAIDQGINPGYRLCYPSEGLNSSVQAKVAKPISRAACVRVGIVGTGAGVSGSSNQALASSCGLVRGLISVLPLADMYLSRALQVLGVASPEPADKFRELTLPNGKVVIPFWAHTNDLGAFISLDPADWE